MKYLFLVLFAITIWIIIIVGAKYLPALRAKSFVWTTQKAPLALPPAAAARAPAPACCLQSPCSPDCARELESLRTRANEHHEAIVAELGKILTAGDDPEQDSAPVR